MFRTKLIFSSRPKTVAFHFHTNNTTYNTQHQAILKAFFAAPLHFNDDKTFIHSPIYSRLRTIFQENYYLNCCSSTLKTISMQEVISFLNLTATYDAFIDPQKYLLGTHGASVLSLPHIVPYPN